LKSPLHYKLQKQGEQIARAGVFVSVSVFCILIFWIAYSIIVMNDYYAYRAHSADVINHLVFCIALIVVTIPEGLKFVETLAVS
jgi:magnesium-transporting ATPase (P-type)